jgi:signal transduction histidine kinase
VQGYLTAHPSEHAEASIVIIKAQRFYRTGWFIALMVLLLFLLAWLVYSMKVRRVKARFQLVLDERVRLAREMHDTVLQGCASVSSLLEASANSENDRETQRVFIDYARGQISATMDEARHAVWNLRNRAIARVDLGKNLLDLADRMKIEFGKEVNCDIDQDLPWTDPGTSHEVVMVVREALHNSIVHSNAEAIQLKAKHGRTKAVLSISDNGKGFDLLRPIPSGHYGLAGMKERVQRVGGRFRVVSSPGKGTRVIFTVRLNPGDSR